MCIFPHIHGKIIASNSKTSIYKSDIIINATDFDSINSQYIYVILQTVVCKMVLWDFYSRVRSTACWWYGGRARSACMMRVWLFLGWTLRYKSDRCLVNTIKYVNTSPKAFVKIVFRLLLTTSASMLDVHEQIRFGLHFFFIFPPLNSNWMVFMVRTPNTTKTFQWFGFNYDCFGFGGGFFRSFFLLNIQNDNKQCVRSYECN